MFTKNDLKSGMVVETREGNRYMVLEDRLIREGGFLYFSDYYVDLSFQDNNVYDIMKVWKPTIRSIKGMLEGPDNLIWVRRTPKEMTIKEIEVALGYPVKIVKEQ